MAEHIKVFPKFAPTTVDAFNTTPAELVNLNELFGDQFFGADMEALDFLKDISSDSKAFDMDELMDIGVEMNEDIGCARDLSGGMMDNKSGAGRKATLIKDMSNNQKDERRERNREHAKKSRIRKKVLLDTLQDSLTELRGENQKLRRIITDRLPEQAARILEQCTNEESLLLDESSEVSGRIDAQKPEDGTKLLVESDFRLIQSLVTAQKNFVVSDPSLPDNPIIYATEGFCKLTGYKRHEVIGRNCRFLQGPGTDPRAVDLIRQGIAEGRDVSVCLLNYKADGTPFWNQFFVAALRDADGSIVNHIGVQCEVDNLSVANMKERVKKLPLLSP